MSLSWLRSCSKRLFRPPSRPRRELLRARPTLEPLEGRIVPAPISTGNPISVAPTLFSGAGGTQASGGGSLAALQTFEKAIGGADNGNTAQPFSAGFRTINWDGVKLNSSDFPGTEVINNNETIGIPINRFQTRGVSFETVYAVSGDGFVDVNPSVAGLTNFFSPSNTFAMFNTNDIDLSFVVPSTASNAVAPAATRGFGAIFINNQIAGTSSIEYFNGTQSLGTFFVPPTGAGQTSFLGALFPSPVVTSVKLTLGSAVLFSFDGGTITPGSAPANELSVVDDFAYAEPVPVANAVPVSGTAGPHATFNAQVEFTATPNTPFTGTVATFHDNGPNPNPVEFFATINWGDGHQTSGTIVANGSGGFDVVGTNTYTNPGLFPVQVSVQQFDSAGTMLLIDNTGRVGTPDQLFLAQAYKDLLGRTIDPVGLSVYSDLLASGGTHADVVQSITTSVEYDHNLVGMLYQVYLHRTPDTAGLNNGTAFLQSGGSVENFIAGLVVSPEFVNVQGGGTFTGYLTALFEDALGRAPTASELNQFSTDTLLGAAQAVLRSPEYAGRTTDFYFQDFLRRNATASEQAAFGALIERGSIKGVPGDSLVVAGIVGSPEYQNLVNSNGLLLPVVPLNFFQPNPG
jgi:hypothetical protein